MTSTWLDITPYLSAAERGELIITANNRQRNHVLRAYGERKHQAAWVKPRIYSLSQWIDINWALLQRRAYRPAGKQIIGNSQRQCLWENIITHSSLAAALLQPEPLAQAADSALRNLELWQLTEDDVRDAEPQLTATSNSYCWLTWLGEFRAKMTALGFITYEQATDIVKNAFAAGEVAREPVIHLSGFDDIPPLHQDLINSACQQLNIIKPENSTIQLTRTELATSEDEIRSAALWSKRQIKEEPGAMVGIIVPNLGQCRDQVERIFTEVFEPLALLPENPRYTLPFNFSAGIPLGATPIIAATLDLLELHRSNWDVESICHLLLSPFFGDADKELVLRTQLVTQLRRQAAFTLSLSDVRYWCRKLSLQLGVEENETSLDSRLVQLENYRRQTYGNRSAHYWSEFFQLHLQRLGWPGARRLDSQEHQQLCDWNGLIESFVQLDNAGIQFSYLAAVQQLRTLANSTPFQAQTPNSPIQILGALEGAGLQFSHCWVVGLHHRQWPPAPAPNPLLPTSLQRAHKMPHASAERELEFARALTLHYRQCAPKVVFSSALCTDEGEVSPSALIRAWPVTPITELTADEECPRGRNYQRIAAHSRLEIVNTASAPSLDVNGEPVRGGATLFKEQAACPFNAFARLRLGAVRIDPPVSGLSPIERGNLLHDSLAFIWRELRSQARLLELDTTALHALTNTATQAAMDFVKQRRATSLGAMYERLELERLGNMIQQWLALERSRPAFSVVAIEQDVEVVFAGLPLKLRIDRIDRLERSGDLILIDYKTGNPSAKSWQGARMDEPQLPLYAVTAPDPVAAISFAQINAKAMQWIGVGELQVRHPGIEPVKTPWKEQLSEWATHLQTLAHGFIQGDARVDMKNATASKYAEDLVPLNRLAEKDALETFARDSGGVC